MQGQVSKTYIQELEVDENTTIVTNVPTSINQYTNGTMTCNNTKDRYAINGKDGDVRLNIFKDLNIDTWDKQIIKQEVVITVKASSASMEQEILEAFKIKLKKGAVRRVKID